MLTRWNEGSRRRSSGDGAFGALSELRRDMDRLFADFDRDWIGPAGRRVGPPVMEMNDEGEALTVRVEVPGFGHDDLHIDLHRSGLSIRGERSAPVPEGYSVHRQERGAMAFSRTVSLPCRVEAEQVSASLRDGVLEISLPKAAEEQPRTIEVRPVS